MVEVSSRVSGGAKTDMERAGGVQKLGPKDDSRDKLLTTERQVNS